MYTCMYAWCTVHCAVGCIFTHVHILTYYMCATAVDLGVAALLKTIPNRCCLLCMCHVSAYLHLLGVPFLLSLPSHLVSSPYLRISSTYSFYVLILPALVLPISFMHALAGGLFTGAEVLKTVEERKLYGGLANAPYDPCYHQVCVLCVCVCVCVCVVCVCVLCVCVLCVCVVCVCVLCVCVCVVCVCCMCVCCVCVCSVCVLYVCVCCVCVCVLCVCVCVVCVCMCACAHACVYELSKLQV